MTSDRAFEDFIDENATGIGLPPSYRDARERQQRVGTFTLVIRAFDEVGAIMRRVAAQFEQSIAPIGRGLAQLAEAWRGKL